MARPTRLSAPATVLVLKTLRASVQPMTAYSLLEALKKQGIKSPPIIYRALESLIKQGAVHKIQVLNAFIACDCPPDHAHSVSVLTVCNDCERVEELHDHAVIHHLEALQRLRVPLVSHAVIELPVQCGHCDA